MKVSTSNTLIPSRHNGSLAQPLIMLMVVLVLLVCAATYVGASKFPKWAKTHGHGALRDDIQLKQAFTRLPGRLIQSLETIDIPNLTIDIKFKNLQKIRKKRKEALAKGFLIQGIDDFVPASIRYGNQKTKVKLRLKGDWIGHLQGKKWSFRIHVKGKDSIFGLRRFSIHHPRERDYQGEILFFESLRQVGVLAPRYFFVNVVVNGEKLGIMALEEHFSKELLESNRARERVIVRFDESLLWAGRSIGLETFYNYRNTQIDAFRSSKIAKSPRLSNENATSVGLLRGFTNGELPASHVFDAELMGRFLAVAELWGAWHSTVWHNLRFSLNPITVKLEPIAFDANIGDRKPPDEIITFNEPITVALLDDPNIFSVFRKTLLLLGREINQGDFLDRLATVEDKHLVELQKEFYLLEAFPLDELRTRANYLTSLSEENLRVGATKAYPLLLHAYQLKDGDGLYLEIGNAVPHEVEVQSIRWVAKGGNPSIPFQPRSTVAFPVRLPATPVTAAPQTNRIYYQSPPESAKYALEISGNIKGLEQRYAARAVPCCPTLKEHPIPVSTIQQQLSQHSFLTLDTDKRALLVTPGQWQVEGSIVVPPGFSLTVSGDTTLRFSTEGMLIAYGPLNFSGTDQARILFEGLPAKNGEGTWPGIAVLTSGSLSRWSHVTIRNTAGIQLPGWQLTGGVTFYKSDVHMDHCYFEGNRGEDALNIVHSKFDLKATQIANTVSDAFDADFSDGTVHGGIFQNIGKAGGGDAIDISGSVVTVGDTRFLNINDKALSVGEQSEMTASRVVIERSGTGAASKDGSRLHITDSTIKWTQNAALMAYIKKPEFGSARIEAQNIVFLGPTPKARVQKSSLVTIDGNTVESEDVDVGQLYQTIMKPGLRK